MLKKFNIRDLHGHHIPSKALWAISEISAFLGESLVVSNDHGVAWGDNGAGGYLVYLTWGDEGTRVVLDPPDDYDWKAIYQIIGYCHYHKIECEAP